MHDHRPRLSRRSSSQFYLDAILSAKQSSSRDDGDVPLAMEIRVLYSRLKNEETTNLRALLDSLVYANIRLQWRQDILSHTYKEYYNILGSSDLLNFDGIYTMQILCTILAYNRNLIMMKDLL